MFFVSLVTVVTILIIYYNYFRKNTKAPPGPLGFPFVGTFFSVTKKPHLIFLEWSKKYGPIIQTRIGLKNALVLNSVTTIREAFNDKAFQGRPDCWNLSVLANGKNGVVTTDGQVWTDQRRFLVKTLRDFGFGKQSMESLVMEELLEVIRWMENNTGTPISVKDRFTMSTMNALWTIVAGKRFDHDDPLLVQIMTSFETSFHNESWKSLLILYFPQIFGSSFIVNYIQSHRNPNSNSIGFQVRNDIMEHMKSQTDENNPRDFIDMYMNEIKKTKDVSSSFHGVAGASSLISVAGDIFGAGAGTTSTTLNWSILYLATHPEVQNTLQKEIIDVVGTLRKVSIADKSKMPYTEATILEVLRCSSILPLSLVHNAMTNTTFHGYEIEKDTLVFANLHAAHFSEELWGDPMKFRPERFLSPDGKTIIGKENVLAFSTGRRQCIGESVARDTIFLFVTNIFQKFRVETDPENPTPSLETVSNITQDPKPYKVVLKLRT